MTIDSNGFHYHNPRDKNLLFRENENEILRILQTQDFLLNFSNYLYASISTFENRINNSISILGKFVNVDRILILKASGDEIFFENSFEWCNTGVTSMKAQDQKLISLAHIPQWKQVLIKDGMISASEVSEIPAELKKIIFNKDLKSILIFPLMVFDDLFGFLVFSFYLNIHRWDHSEISFLKNVSMMLSNAFERKLTDEELKAREQKFKDLFNHSTDAIFIYNYRGRILEVNQRLCEMLGYSRENLLGKEIEFVFPAYALFSDQVSKNEHQIGNIYNIESEFRTLSGSLFPVEINNRVIMFSGREAVLCIARDISRRKEMQREILSAIIQTEEKERGRIARDLHDGLAPLLSSLKLYVKVLGTTGDTSRREEMLKITNDGIDESILMIKEITNNLSPHVLNDFGLASAIQSFCKKISLAKTIDIAFESNVFDQRFPSNVEIVLFRVLKELVNNTLKHALASSIEIYLLRTDNMLTLVYNDNGKGFDLKQMRETKSGMGLSNIISRIGSINGKFLFDSKTGKGIQVKIEVGL